MSIDNDDADDDIFLLTDSSSSGGQCTCINYIVHVSNQNSKWPIQRISKSQKMEYGTNHILFGWLSYPCFTYYIVLHTQANENIWYHLHWNGIGNKLLLNT